MYKSFIQALKAKYDLSNKYIIHVVDDAQRAVQYDYPACDWNEYDKLVFDYIVEIFKDDGYTL